MVCIAEKYKFRKTGRSIIKPADKVNKSSQIMGMVEKV